MSECSSTNQNRGFRRPREMTESGGISIRDAISGRENGEWGKLSRRDGEEGEPEMVKSSTTNWKCGRQTSRRMVREGGYSSGNTINV